MDLEKKTNKIKNARAHTHTFMNMVIPQKNQRMSYIVALWIKMTPLCY